MFGQNLKERTSGVISYLGFKAKKCGIGMGLNLEEFCGKRISIGYGLRLIWDGELNGFTFFLFLSGGGWGLDLKIEK